MRKSGYTAVFVLALLAGGCATDNATRLRFAIEKVAARLEAGPDFTEDRVLYVPKGGATKPYWLVFFPERRVYAHELVERGMPEALADDIYRQLGYVGVGMGAMLVVAQEGERLAFTSYHGKDFVFIDDLIVERRVGQSEIGLRKQNETLYITGVL